MPELKLWSNEVELVVAESPEDATKVLIEDCGMHPEDIANFPPWIERTEAVLWLEDECQPLHEAPRKTPRQIVTEHGRGHIPTLPV